LWAPLPDGACKTPFRTQGQEDEHEGTRHHDPGPSLLHPERYGGGQAIEDQVERFAPGFRDRVLARSVMPPDALERHNANLVGGDIGAGVMSLGQLFFRPVARWTPYTTPVRGLYICSASTPQGGAVHGMGGYYAARAALGESMDAPEPSPVTSSGFGTPSGVAPPPAKKSARERE
jgi:hypothetical protein